MDCTVSVVCARVFLNHARFSRPGPRPAHVPLIPLAAGFVLFRVFDISKPGAVRKSESWLKGGQGIMIDDVLAGVMALAALCGFCLLWSLAA